MMSMASSDSKPSGTAGKIIGSLFFAFFLLIGGFFTVLISKQVLQDEGARDWVPTPGELLSAEIAVDKNENEPFSLDVQYQYEVDGVTRTGSTVYLTSESYANYNKAYRQLQELVESSPITVYVHPDRPEETVLLFSSRWSGLFVLFPLVFVAIGLFGLAAIWTRLGSKRKRTVQSISRNAKKKTSPLVFFILFLIVGVGFSWVFIVPAFRLIQSMSWVETPCTILYSELRSYQSDDGTTYKADIFYEYAVFGEIYRSNRVRFLGGSSSGRQSKVNQLKEYPVGSEQRCFVNPSDPSQAVLIRRFSWIFAFSLIPLLFVVIGLGGIFQHLKKEQKAGGANSLRQPVWDSEEHRSEEEIRLKAGQSRWARVVMLLLVALFWNGAVFGLLVPDVLNGGGVFLGLFSLPFIAVGIGLVVAVIVCFLKTMNPRIDLYLRPGVLHPGDRAELRWVLTGGLKPLEQFRMTLYGQEHASYRRGTNTYHDKQKFQEQVLVDTSDAQDLQAGELDLTIPENAMPTFTADHNKIQWFIRVEGVISRWPDLTATVEITLSTPKESA